MKAFNPEEFLPLSAMSYLTEIRVSDPDRSMRAAKARRRRERLAIDGRLSILAADHPARRVTAVGDNPLAMANRHDYLARVARVLQSDKVDGVMATMDIIEDLLTLHDHLSAKSGRGLLDDKLLIGSLNRGGLAGVSWEMDDPLTGAAPATCAEWNLDGAKFLLRICDDDPASLVTMRAAVGAITELNALRLPMFLEPLPAVRSEKGYKVVKTADALAKITGVASALGDSSRYLWLKLPYCENFETVVRATTLPILLLGGEATGDPTQFMREIALAINLGARGALVGRNVLYPGAEDPLVVAEAVSGIIHSGWTADQALTLARETTEGKFTNLFDHGGSQ
ncbi:MAG: deoxyribose-phosphate aldolase [Blastocatellales bacterium]